MHVIVVHCNNVISGFSGFFQCVKFSSTVLLFQYILTLLLTTSREIRTVFTVIHDVLVWQLSSSVSRWLIFLPITYPGFHQVQPKSVPHFPSLPSPISSLFPSFLSLSFSSAVHGDLGGYGTPPPPPPPCKNSCGRPCLWVRSLTVVAAACFLGPRLLTLYRTEVSSLCCFVNNS